MRGAIRTELLGRRFSVLYLLDIHLKCYARIKALEKLSLRSSRTSKVTAFIQKEDWGAGCISKGSICLGCCKSLSDT